LNACTRSKVRYATNTAREELSWTSSTWVTQMRGEEITALEALPRGEGLSTMHYSQLREFSEGKESNAGSIQPALLQRSEARFLKPFWRFGNPPISREQRGAACPYRLHLQISVKIQGRSRKSRKERGVTQIRHQTKVTRSILGGKSD